MRGARRISPASRILVLFLLPLLLSGCFDFSYYLQAAEGQLEIMRRSRPLAEVIADPQTPPAIREKLTTVAELRSFAVTELGLPDNDSYRSYADLERPYALWNVIAAPEFSLQPKQWCFPVAGCVNYKGYFERRQANRLGAALNRQGFDTYIYGVEAYSTLNWFADPVLNTFVDSSELRLAGLLFHELAHQLIYLEDDSAFNEAFAMSVQLTGMQRWFESRGDPGTWQLFLTQQQQSRIFHDFLRQVRDQLEQLYRRPLPPEQLRAAKQEQLENARRRYQELRQSGQLDQRFDRWMAGGLNNARLAGIATYRDLLPAFQALLAECRGDLDQYYRRVREIGELPHEQRRSYLARLPGRPAARHATGRAADSGRDRINSSRDAEADNTERRMPRQGDGLQLPTPQLLRPRAIERPANTLHLSGEART